MNLLAIFPIVGSIFIAISLSSGTFNVDDFITAFEESSLFNPKGYKYLEKNPISKKLIPGDLEKILSVIFEDDETAKNLLADAAEWPLLFDDISAKNFVLSVDSEGGTLLHGIAQSLSKDCDTVFLEWILLNGADINKKNNQGKTPFDLLPNDATEVVKKVLKEKMRTIDYAIWNGNLDAVKTELGKNKKLIQDKNLFGRPILMNAMLRSDAVAQYLIDQGAKIDTENLSDRFGLLHDIRFDFLECSENPEGFLPFKNLKNSIITYIKKHKSVLSIEDAEAAGYADFDLFKEVMDQNNVLVYKQELPEEDTPKTLLAAFLLDYYELITDVQGVNCTENSHYQKNLQKCMEYLLKKGASRTAIVNGDKTIDAFLESDLKNAPLIRAIFNKTAPEDALRRFSSALAMLSR